MPDQPSDNPTDLFKSLRGRSPEEAKFFWSGGPVEVGERTWFQSVFSGCTGFETEEGVVLVDSGLAQLGPKLAALLRQKTPAPIHTAVFTHGHVDHAFGLEAFLVPGQKLPRIIAHRAMPARFARYERTRRHNAALNARQFGGAVQEAETSDKFDNFKRPALMPDTLYDDELTIRVGGVAFDIRHGRGETDDHSYVFCRERGVLCSGDFFIWSVPNAGNPQKVQRYPWDWADALRAMAALAPRALCPGHGGPVVGDAPLIRRMLVETADYLDAAQAGAARRGRARGGAARRRRIGAHRPGANDRRGRRPAPRVPFRRLRAGGRAAEHHGPIRRRRALRAARRRRDRPDGAQPVPLRRRLCARRTAVPVSVAVVGIFALQAALLHLSPLAGRGRIAKRSG